MGKSWIRATDTQNQPGRNSQIPVKSVKRKPHVWVRGSTNSGPDPEHHPDRARNPEDGGSPSTLPSLSSDLPSGAPSAVPNEQLRQRRLAAQGRFAAAQPNAHSTVTKGAAPADENSACESVKGAAAEAREREKLRKEAETLQKLIAKEEYRIKAAENLIREKAAQKAQSERVQQEEREKRKGRLDAGFAEAFKLARELDAGQGMPKVNAASNSEVDRVLKAKTDYDVMQVKPGANVAAVKKRYRAMTLALHPDKCKAENATNAFQRMVHAYQSILKTAG